MIVGPARPAAAAVCAVLLLLGGCATRQPAPWPDQRDGPEARPPSGLEQVPNAEPRVEPLRVGGPNKPYEVFGQRYVPVTEDRPLTETGLASWYGRKFHGRPTASGEPYDMYAMTAAHKTMPIPSYARIRNPANGRSVVVRVNDRGPFAPGRVIDLSYTAALKLGLLSGVAPVEVARLTHAEILAGSGTVAASARNEPSRPATAAIVTPPTVALASAAPTADADPIAAFAASLDDAVPGDRPDIAPGAWWLQLGAFRVRDVALRLQQRALAERAAPGVAVVEEGGHHRVQAGPYPSRAQALVAAVELQRRLGAAAPPLLLQRDSAP